MNVTVRNLIIISGLALVSLANSSAHASDEAKITPEQKASAKKMIWEDRDLSGLDLSNGPGASDGSTRPVGPLKWKGESDYKDSTSPKFSVVDKNGRKFRVKFQEGRSGFLKPNNDEVHSENVAFRLLYALGYRGQETYFVSKSTQLEIEGLSDEEFKTLKKVKKYLNRREDGKVVINADASFKFKDPTVLDDSEGWSYGDATVPFAGTKYLSGMLILDVMLNNFDTHPGNTNVQYVKKSDGSIEAWYTQADAGASLGQDEGLDLIGHLMPRTAQSKWVLGDYARSQFIANVRDGMIHFHYMDNQPVKFRREAHRHIPLVDAQWFTGILNRLTDAQIHQIFNASSDDQKLADAFAEVFIRKANELRKATGVTQAAPVATELQRITIK